MLPRHLCSRGHLAGSNLVLQLMRCVSTARAARATAAPAPADASSPSLVSVDYVGQNLPSMRVLDGSWHAPVTKHDSYGHFLHQRVPTAAFFDITKISDTESPLPHAFPSEETFAREVGQKLGVTEDDHVVVYDTIGIFSAPRVWFSFRAMGHKRVSIMQGGLTTWMREGYPIATGPAATVWPSRTYNAKLNKKLLVSYEDVLKNIDSKEAQVLDARSPGRFEGVEPEPRPVKGGHIPNSINVPFVYLTDDFTGALKPTEALRHVFERSGVDLSDKEKPIITSCGSGVTACFLIYALHLLGHNNVSLFSGSWTEYASRQGSPIVQGRNK